MDKSTDLLKKCFINAKISSMFKKLLLLILISFVLPVSAGELEDALKNNNYVFAYFYTPECGFCRKFDDRYNKLSSTYKNQFKFVKINVNTKYGYSLMRAYNGRYVPFVLLLNSKTKQGAEVYHQCLFDTSCTEKVFKEFRN